MDTVPREETVEVVSALGIRIELRASPDLPAPLLSRIEDAWSDCRPARAAADEPERSIRLTGQDFDDAERGLSDLSTRVTLEALDALRGRRLLLHAAGVAAEDGRTIALVGPSGRGKTTASRHLGGHFSYVSDETVSVDADLSVEPYRKPLSVITDGLAHKEQIAPSAYGLKDLPTAPLRLTAITLLERRPDAAHTGLETVDLIDAICEMTPQISYLPDLAQPLQYLARVFDAIGAPTHLVYRDAVDLPELVAGMFASPAHPNQEWALPRRGPATSSWRATAFDDAILVDGRACILREGVVTALDQRGCLVWAQCLAGVSVPQIVATAIAEFGDPGAGAADDLISATLSELRDAGLLEAA